MIPKVLREIMAVQEFTKEQLDAAIDSYLAEGDTILKLDWRVKRPTPLYEGMSYRGYPIEFSYVPDNGGFGIGVVLAD